VKEVPMIVHIDLYALGMIALVAMVVGLIVGASVTRPRL